MASASLIGISATSGIPLFVRHVGAGKPLPFALIASLNGVHVFGEAQGVTLWNAACSSSTVMWKTFHNSIRLILVRGSEYNAEHQDNVILELAFASLVLLIGLNNLLSQNNVDRLKKDLRPCFPLLDELLERYLGTKEYSTFSHLVRCADYILPPDQLNIQPELDKYTDEADSSYGCIMRSSGPILFATKSFWALSNNELVLLPLMLSAKPAKMSVGRDIPIYLPDRSPNPCFPLLDELLERYLGTKAYSTFSHLVRCADYILPPDQLNIQPELDKYTDEADSSYGCIMRSSGPILFATKSFWALSNNELVLLPLMLSAKPAKMSVGRDIPIYLPDRSPNVPFRLIVIRLAGPLLVLTLCGPSPSLSAVMKSAAIFWGSHYLTLDAVAAASTCSLPPTMHAVLDQSIMGLLLINYDTKRCLSCLHLKGEKQSISPNVPKSSTKMNTVKADLITSFYRSMVGFMFHPPGVPPDDLPSIWLPSNHTPKFAYVVTDDFRVVICQRSSHQLFLLFPALLPLHIAKDLTDKSFDILTKGKGARL